MRVLGSHETRRFRAEHELVLLAVLAAHTQTLALVAHEHDRAGFRAAAEVLDASARAYTRERSRRAKHLCDGRRLTRPRRPSAGR